ncbi:hypothetical protein H5410_026756 [Solanum commersonii]|uniref:Uncharacterized protein n=1 Tax=Solanum commersonii TaxID=4109 RepID=A0A9J5YZS8_SOLCO|nr:hypothetical protein H5410_026756 [Solanum commersonii]
MVAFWVTMTLPFPGLIFRLCHELMMPLLRGIDLLISKTQTLDVGLIWDMSNPAAPLRGS